MSFIERNLSKMSLLQNDDLDNYVDTFRNVFLKQSLNKKNGQELMSLIEQISIDLERSQENEKCLNNNLKVFIDNQDVTITTKYTLLEEKCSKFEKDNRNLKIQLEELNVQMKRELETQVNEYLQKIKELEESSQSEIANLQNRIRSDRICFETKERELNNEIQLAQANTALQCDEIESNLKRQLVDVTSKLRQSQNSSRALQLEITNLRNQLQTQQKLNNDLRNKLLYFNESPVNVIKNNLKNNETSYMKSNIEENSINFKDYLINDRPSSRQSEFSYIQPLERSLISIRQDDHNLYNITKNSQTDKNLQSKPQYLPNNESSEKSTQMNDEPDQQTCFRKQSSRSAMPSPLPICFKNNKGSSISDNNNRPIVYKGRINKNNMVPPLMPCSTNNNTKRTTQRKRKLYDPDNFDYLDLLSNK